MTITIAITGKGGNGKTTVARSLLSNLKEIYPSKTILIVDNDLSSDFAQSFGLEIKERISNIREGRYEYKSKIPYGMPKMEFVEWALQDIIVNLNNDIDLIATGTMLSKQCNCFLSGLINEAMVKLVKQYDIVIFDCEYDLEYLNILVDYPIDVTLIITDVNISSVCSADRILQSSLKLASPGQIGVVLNKVKDKQIPENISSALEEYELDILGRLPYDEDLAANSIEKKSVLLNDAARQLIFRLNLPPS